MKLLLIILCFFYLQVYSQSFSWDNDKVSLCLSIREGARDTIWGVLVITNKSDRSIYIPAIHNCYVTQQELIACVGLKYVSPEGEKLEYQPNLLEVKPDTTYQIIMNGIKTFNEPKILDYFFYLEFFDDFKNKLDNIAGYTYIGMNDYLRLRKHISFEFKCK